MTRWEVTFDGKVSKGDVDVSMSGVAKVDAETEIEAADAGFKKVIELNVFLGEVAWDHVRTVKACEGQCKICLNKCKGVGIEHYKACYAVSENGGGEGHCPDCT